MIVYGVRFSPYVLKVLVALEEKGVAYTLEPPASAGSRSSRSAGRAAHVMQRRSGSGHRSRRLSPTDPGGAEPIAERVTGAMIQAEVFGRSEL